MIVDAILIVLLAPVTLVLSLIPSFNWPSWMDGPGGVVDNITEWGQHVGTIGYWFPVSEFFTALLVVFAAGAASVTIRTLRLVVSYLTGGGGAT